jgi:hypothetical protein
VTSFVRLVSSAAVWVAGCGTDVVLGGAIDGGSDGTLSPDAARLDGGPDIADGMRPDVPDATPFPDGAYDLAISATVTRVTCAGALAGMEDAFSGITRDALGLVDGPVEITGIDATHLEVHGAPIEMGFLETSVSLEKGGGPGVPLDVWIGIGTRAEDGPLGTLLVGIELEAHESSIDASGFDGLAGALYVDPLVEDAQCVIGFDARFDAR